MLIDADNASHRTIPDLLATIEAHGTTVIRRAYGDWRSSNLDVWKQLLKAFAIRPIQRFPIRGGTGRGRNATDIALVVDAMDLLHTAPLDGFCIVSSDSDFADLALRIREAGLMVIGVGRTATPDAFQACCTIFIPTDARVPHTATPRKAVAAVAANDAKRVAAYGRAILQATRDGEWARLTDLGATVPTGLRAKLKWLDRQSAFVVDKRQFKGQPPDVDCIMLRTSAMPKKG
ncbi:NYN domain-containing protein [Roseomonas sp. CECT 9278]|uniref:NYN domain-containing protein n=1 Tax=Roseomonas sp. CECT 9278 TaxID=2845823 RepID=UPI001E359F87|nr:NYN domain-containing protein [Roseomonas sp. CECT 9278]CAH0188790.1 hypothetical protein ROS9278_01630 [Roseomonas sp. CECT 9278]